MYQRLGPFGALNQSVATTLSELCRELTSAHEPIQYQVHDPPLSLRPCRSDERTWNQTNDGAYPSTLFVNLFVLSVDRVTRAFLLAITDFRIYPQYRKHCCIVYDGIAFMIQMNQIFGKPIS